MSGIEQQPPEQKSVSLGRYRQVTYWLENHPLHKNVKMFLTLVSVFALALTVWAWWRDDARAALKYAVVPSSIQFERPANSKLAVTFDGKPIIDKAVFFERILVWNDGGEAVTKDTVLRPLRVLIDSGKVLSVSLSKTSRPEVSVRLDWTSDRQVGVDFNVLEEDDGFNVEIIYSSDRRSSIRLDGVVIGQKGRPEYIDAFWHGSGGRPYVKWAKGRWLFYYWVMTS